MQFGQSAISVVTNEGQAPFFPELGVQAENYGASPSATAAINTAAIQAALDAGGRITLSTPGVYSINAGFTVYDNTEINLASGVELKAVTGGAGGVNTFNIFKNQHANSTPVRISSISAATFGNLLVRVTVVFSAAHGCAADGYVQIKGDGFGIYNGIHKVEAVSTTSVANDTLTYVISVAAGSVNAPPSAAASVASASQTVATPGVFTTADNTFAAGQAVTITGTPPGGFSTGTVYYVIKNGLTGTTIQLADSPYATTGKQVTSSSSCTVSPVYYGAPANGNISISGGRLNSNFAAGGFTASANTADHCIVLRRVLNPKIEKLAVFDSRKYAVMLQDTVNPSVDSLHGESGSDCIKVYGPCWNAKIRNISGSWGDDVCSFQPIDNSGYTNYMLGSGFDLGGDIWNGHISEMRVDRAHQSGAFVLYPNGNSGAAGATNEIYRIRGLQQVFGVSTQDPYYSSSWYGGSTVTVGNGYVTVSGQIEHLECTGTRLPVIDNDRAAVSLTIRNLTVNDPVTDQVNGMAGTPSFVRYATIRNYVINNPSVVSSGASGTAWVAALGANGVIENLVINGGSFRQIATGSLTAAYIVSGGTINRVTFVGTRFRGDASGYNVYGVSANASGTLGSAEFLGCNFGQYSRALTNANGVFAGTPNLKVIGGTGDTNYQNVADLTSSQSANIWLRDFSAASGAGGVFNFYGTPGTINLYISGLTYTGTLFANANGTISMFNPDGTCPIDLSKLTRTVGQIAKSTGNGTIVANNLAVCDGTGAANSWKQITNTANTY